MSKSKNEALINSIGLETNANGVVVDSTSGLVPDSAAYADIYYPSLLSKIINQEVESFVRGGVLLEQVFRKEEWANGLKNLISTGLPNMKDYTPDITIDDLNTKISEPFEISAQIDFRKQVNVRLSENQIITAFTSANGVSDLANLIIKRAKEIMLLFIQNTQAKLITNDTTTFTQSTSDGDLEIKAPFEMNYDEVEDTSSYDLDTTDGVIELLETINNDINDLKAISTEHLTNSDLGENKIPYSAGPENLALLVNTTFSNQIKKADSTLFNLKAIKELGVEVIRVPFSKMGVDSDIATATKAILIDKETLRMGYMLEATRTIKLINLQNRTEFHNWFGWLVNPFVFKKLYQDSTTVIETK